MRQAITMSGRWRAAHWRSATIAASRSLANPSGFCAFR
jgi:hypothetical protein